ncbi:MAG TPA: prolyl oligopeptidase family serine peptidase, partial [Acidobacteriota bacterium]|nr:prolyl oligopeptidase family serine peptidase [Acidobacteriota bacterium]
PTRVTQTHEEESDVRYAKDDSGFTFRRGNGVFRASFSSPVVRELNPELPKKMTMQSYELSPDESKILIVTNRETAPSRKISYVTFRGRFAEAKTADRGVADDPYKTESYLFVYDLDDDPAQHPEHDGKPWQIYRWSEGEEFGRTSIAENPWAPDSQHLVYATWRDKSRELAIVVADVAARTVRSVYTDNHEGGPDTPIVARPFFTPEGDRIVTVLEKTGFRHPWMIDPATGDATQLTEGDFEVYPQEFGDTGERLFVRSDRENPARMDAYAVDTAGGSMARLTSRPGVYDPIVLSHDHARLATVFSSWNEPHELYVVDAQVGTSEAGGEASVTRSHPVSLSDVLVLTPQLFAYENRHGQTIRGFVFHPPGWQPTDERPLMVYVYGGPLITRKQVTDGTFNASGYLFNMYLALRHGYVTATIDPRGNSGYGAVFESANWENIGTPQTEDLVDGVRYLIDNHGVDADKVGLNGWSFGGFQTQHAMYTAPDVFRLGIAGAGPTEWQNYNTWYANTFVGDSPLGDPTELDQYSLTRLAKNLEGPLLLLHGMEDTNVLFQDTVFVYRELLNYGKGPLVELVVDPTGGHGLGGDIETLDRYQIYEAFLMKHWGPYRHP